MNTSDNITWVESPLAGYYAVIVPVLLCGLTVAIVGNLYLLLCIRWIRTQAMTANMRLSLSLAGSDLWAAILMVNGLLVNNVIPHIMGVWFGDWIRCHFLVFELLRVSGLITSALHLLALALNHFFSIVSPLKYQITMTPRFIYTCIIVLWVLPVVSNFCLASSYEGDGFRSRMCEIGFYFRFWYRLIIFLQFIIPLGIMLLIYTYVLIRLSVARRRMSMKQTRGGRVAKVRHRGGGGRGSIQWTVHSARPSLGVGSINVKSKVRAVTTTMLIVGTFVLGWMPAVSVFVLVCNDCLTSNTGLDMLPFNTLANVSIVLKLALNPFIYAYRLVEIQYALWIMHSTRFGRRVLDMNRLPVKFKRMAPSVSAHWKMRSDMRWRPIPILISSSASCVRRKTMCDQSCSQVNQDTRNNVSTRLTVENSGHLISVGDTNKRHNSWHAGGHELLQPS